MECEELFTSKAKTILTISLPFYPLVRSDQSQLSQDFLNNNKLFSARK